MKNRGIRMSSLLTLSNLAIVLLILSGAVFLFARTYQQQLIGTARTNSLRTVTQVSSTVNDYLAEINAVMRTLEEEMTDAEKRRTTATAISVRRREPGRTASISLWICSAFFPSRTDMSPRRTL